MTFALTFMLVFIMISGLTALAIYLLGEAIKKQAQKPVKRFFAPIPKPGTSVFVALEGRIERVIENVVGWTLNDNKLFIPQTEEPEPSFLAKHLGVTWIGLFSTIKRVDWEWPEFRQVEREGRAAYEIKARNLTFEEFFFQFPYPVMIRGVELKGNIQADLVIVTTVYFLNPIRAVFLNKNPVDLLIAMVTAAIRSWMSDQEFDSIKTVTVSSNKNADVVPGFWEMLEKLNGLNLQEEEPDKGRPLYETENSRGVYGKLGMLIVRTEFVSIEAQGAAAAAIEQQQINLLQGDAAITAAEKARQVTVIQADARRQAAELDAIAQRTLNEQNAGYYASLPGGQRMFVAHRLASEESDMTTWVEGREEVQIAVPLPPAPPVPEKPKK